MNHSMHAGHGKADHLHADPSTGVAALKDPVCGMTVTAQSPHHAEHMGRRFFFCGPKCKTKFDADPMLYMGQSTDKAAEQPVVAGTVYTCPMHLEIRQDHPGNCPKCGMTLEHVMPSLVDVAADRYCFRTGHVWTPTAVDGHGVTELGGVHTGYPHRGVGRVAVYFEAAAVTISLPLLGQMLELKARSQTSAAIKSLLDLAPKTARRIKADGTGIRGGFSVY